MTTTSEIITTSDVASDTPGSTTTDDDSQQPRPLGSLLAPTPGTLGETPPVVTAQVVTCDGQDVVLIGPSTAAGGSEIDAADITSGRVAVVDDAGVLSTREGSDAATPVSNPARRESVLRRTLSRLVTRYRDAVETARREATENARLTAEQTRVRSRLRSYVIALYKGDDLDREQVDDFLAEFDLSAYRPTFRVDY